MYETLSGDEISDLILKNKAPERKKDQDLTEEEKSSALGSMGLKPNLVH
jgi:cell division protease FtsH